MTRPSIAILARFFRRLVRMRTDTGGNFSIMTALLLVPLLGVAGMSMDVVRAYEVRETIQQAADAAVLNAVSTDNWQRYVAPGANEAQLNRLTRTKAEAVFKSILRDKGLPGNISAKATAGMVGRQLHTRLAYTYDVPTTLLHVLGYASLTIGGNAYGKSLAAQYSNIHVLVDNSPSMGIGATLDAINRMRVENRDKSNASEGCVFACHVVDEEEPDTYYLMQSKGIPMRIDTVKQALNTLATSIEQARVEPQQYQVSLYSLGEDSRSILQAAVTAVGQMTNDIPLLRTYISKIELMLMVGVDDNDRRATYLAQALGLLKSRIPTPGNGESPSTPEQLLIIVSDGLGHSPRRACRGRLVLVNEFYHCLEPPDQTVCEAIKKRGIRIATLYTTYLPIPGNIWYDREIAPMKDSIPAGMRDCASPGLFFQVDFNQSMDQAMHALFMQAFNAPTLGS